MTDIVKEVTSYEAIPFLPRVDPKSGKDIIVNGKATFFSPFWAEFKSYFPSYEVWIEGKFTDILLQTKAGNRTVGAIIRQGTDAILYLPPPCYKKAPNRSEQKRGSDRALTAGQFSKKLAAGLVSLAGALASEQAATAPPNWSEDSQYRLPQESVLELNILDVQQQIDKLLTEKRQLEQDLIHAGNLRRLWYEQGKPLEDAILEALRLMGFKAEGYEDSESEFDAVFTSAEGRFLGEAEGKDNRPINVDKYSQLERNLNEDFAREEVTEYAKGVLFGNGFRLIPPAERGETFTEKCLSSARRTGVALVRTMDLFEPARYLKTHVDPEYGRLCR